MGILSKLNILYVLSVSMSVEYLLSLWWHTPKLHGIVGNILCLRAYVQFVPQSNYVNELLKSFCSNDKIDIDNK